MRTFLFCISLLLLSNQLWAKVDLSANRTVLSLNESISVELKVTGDNSAEPNFSPLEKDFDIVSKSQSQQMQIINSKVSRSKNWSLTLMPKRAGEMRINGIKVGNEISNPLQLVIHNKQHSNPSAMAQQDVFIETELTPLKQAYIQQAIQLSIKIYYQIAITQASLGEFSIEDAIVEQLGEDKQYTTQSAGRHFQVIERNYLIFPQKKGILNIPPILFEAYARASLGNNWPFLSQQFSLQNGQKIIRRSEAKSIKIKAKPSNIDVGYWLPAEHVEVSSEHSSLNQLKIGDAITITDRIRAKGSSASLLPELSIKTQSGLKIYPEKAVLKNDDTLGKRYALREQKIAIIPTQPGNYQLPDRELVWWDVKQQKLRREIIPGLSFTISPESNPKQLIESNINNTQDTSENTTPKQEISTPQNWFQNVWFWLWLLTLLSLSGIILWLLLRKPGTLPKANPNVSVDNKHPTIEQIISLIKDKNFRQSYEQLLKFKQHHAISNTNLDEALRLLELHLYAPEEHQIKEIQADLLAELSKFKQHFQQKNHLSPNDVKIPPLNP